tara:strand:- start:175383 stop:176141 length:759 start_codon:yes stop_codon:yes gene_type:complete
MYYQIFILLLSFALSILGIIFYQKSKLQKRNKIILISLLGALYIGLTQYFPFRVQVYKLIDQRTANEMIVSHAMAELVYNPVVEKYVDGKDSDEVYKEFKELFKLGRRRFNYEELKQWKEILLQIFKISDAACAEVFVGNLARAEFYNYVMMLKPRYVEQWISLMSKAIVYEITLKEYFPPNKNEYERALEKVFLSEKNLKKRSKLKRSYNMITLIPDKEVCELAEYAYTKSAELSETEEEEYLKYLVAINE